ncbi:MAG TPA: hypothetical protein VI540_07550 [Gaiellaceae bacterium]|nr:hypothetical protein [Gaiellaceae bacterium]
MSQIHVKGRLLQILAESGAQWDYELFERIAREYAEVEGEYWYDTIRLNLADLYSSGLITEVDEALDPSKSFGREKILLRFEVTSFGRERMAQSDLAGVAA